jgi:hypothetical protein
MFDLNQKANRGEVVVGWYTTGSKVRPHLSSKISLILLLEFISYFLCLDWALLSVAHSSATPLSIPLFYLRSFFWFLLN